MYIGPNIVTDGLVLALDAGSKKSYSGSGNVWNSIVGSVSGSLTNGASYSNSRSGEITFDAVNDYVDISDYPISNLVNGFTWGGWVRHTDETGSWSWLFAGSNLSDGQGYSWFQIGKKSGSGNIRFETGDFFSNTTLDTTTSNIADGDPHHIVGLVNLSLGVKQIYVDGELASSTSVTTNNSNSNYGHLLMGCQGRTNTTVLEFWPGGFYNAFIYERALSSQEVLQNYNSTKSRFI